MSSKLCCPLLTLLMKQLLSPRTLIHSVVYGIQIKELGAAQSVLALQDDETWKGGRCRCIAIAFSFIISMPSHSIARHLDFVHLCYIYHASLSKLGRHDWCQLSASRTCPGTSLDLYCMGKHAATGWHEPLLPGSHTQAQTDHLYGLQVDLVAVSAYLPKL